MACCGVVLVDVYAINHQAATVEHQNSILNLHLAEARANRCRLYGVALGIFERYNGGVEVGVLVAPLRNLRNGALEGDVALCTSSEGDALRELCHSLARLVEELKLYRAVERLVVVVCDSYGGVV